MGDNMSQRILETHGKTQEMENGSREAAIHMTGAPHTLIAFK